MNLGLLLLGTLSQLYLLIDTTGCKVSPQFPLWAALLCLVIWLSVQEKHGVLIGLAVFGVLGFVTVRSLLPDLKLEFQDFCDCVTGVFYETVLYRGRSYPYLKAAQDHTILFLVFTALIAGYAAMALFSKGARISLVLIGSLPLFAICVLVNETPFVPAVAGLVLYLFLTAVGGSFYWENSGSYAAVLGCLLPLTLLTGLLLVYINPEEYSYEPPKLDFRNEIREALEAADQWADNLFEEHQLTVPEFLQDSRQDSSEAPVSQREEDLLPADPAKAGDLAAESNAPAMIWQGTGGTLDLTLKADAENLDLVFLRVKADGSGRLYLRGSSFGDYTGTGWLQAEEQAEVSSLPFTANAIAAVGGEEQMLSIRDAAASAYRFLPYFSREEQGSDSYVPSDGKSRYDAAFVSLPSLSELDGMPQSDEKEIAYRSYAHTVYTRLPDSTRATILPLLAQAGLYPGGENLIAGVAAYIQHAGTYDLNTPAYPSSDYASYFLTTAHQGYCIHFATAAAAAYRSLGIPARVTAGFVTEVDAGRYTEVKGSDAHAWVEIYQDGIGWIPVEVTGQSGMEDGIPGADDAAAEDAGTEITEEESTDPGESGTEGADSGETEQQAGDGLLQNEMQGGTAEEDGAGTAVQPPEPTEQLPVGMVTQPVPQPDYAALQKQANLRRALILTAVLVLPAAFILLRRAAILSFRRRKTSQKDTHKAVIAVYRIAEKISSFGTEIPREIKSCAEKAAFSAHAITPEEASVSLAQLKWMQQRTYSRQNRWNKLRFKYIKALI